MHTSEEFWQHQVCPWQVNFWNLETLGEKKGWRPEMLQGKEQT